MYEPTLNNRLNSVKDTVSEKKLKKYALEDPNEQVREIAVSKLKDSIVLSHIVLNDRSVNVAKKAVKNIEDEYELKNLFIMMNESGIKYDTEIYLEIINKVTDITYLIEMINVDFFSEILNKINAINPLITLSVKKYNYNLMKTKKFLFSNIYSQKKLKKILLNENIYYYRKLAIQHINKPDFIVKIATTDKNEYIRREAVKKIENQDILIKIATTDTESMVRLEAVKNIENQDMLIKIATTDRNNYFRREAVKKIENQDVLVKIASNDLNEEVQIEAIQRIKNHDIVLDFLLNKSSYVVRKLIKKIDDQPSLLEIALSNEETKEKLDDETKILYDTLKKEVG